MTSFPRSPRLAKGALLTLGTSAAPIVFQYNPESLQRVVTPRYFAVSTSGEHADEPRLAGPPQEQLSLTLELDAADELERGMEPAVSLGVHARLAALEVLITPPSSSVLTNAGLMDLGVLEIAPPLAPLVIFAWGRRMAPVRVSSLSIAEEEFDPELNPIRAKVALTLQVLSYEDLGLASPGGVLALSQQVAKEAMALLSISLGPGPRR